MYETKHKIRQIIKLINNILFFFKIIESNEFRIKEDVNNITKYQPAHNSFVSA